MKLSTIEELSGEISAGKMIILSDADSRENEGDLIFAAKFVDKDKVNFMAAFGRGLICVPMTKERACQLNLDRMVKNNEDKFRTAFTVSVDARYNVTTGISAHDRAETIRLLADINCKAEYLSTPGHIFPLISMDGGVLSRPGHTEAAVDIITLAGINPPVGVICEIMNKDGSMARMEDLLKFSKQHKIKIGTIERLIKHKSGSNNTVRLVSNASLPIQGLGTWNIYVFYSAVDSKEHIAFTKGDIAETKVLARIHSECFTGDVLGSLKCDCRDQLHKSMEMIHSTGAGMIIYLRQEGRGIGLGNKIKAYQLQEKGADTVEANEILGFAPDMRRYTVAAEILKYFNVSSVKLITSNPDKVSGIRRAGITVDQVINLPVRENIFNREYLRTKKEKLGHKIEL